MDRVVVKCPRCSLGHRLPVASQGEVTCQKCGEKFWADTRVFDNRVDERVRDVGLAPFDDEAARDLSFGRRPPPEATKIEGGGVQIALGFAKGACPHCGHIMKVSFSESRCPYCDHYSIARDGYLQPIPESYVAPTAVFNVPMGLFERGDIPAVCCACGADATRTIKVGSLVLAPHCKDHSVGASIDTEEGRFGVTVKSHRFYCAAMLLGGTALF